jgi:hypothetical protein
MSSGLPCRESNSGKFRAAILARVESLTITFQDKAVMTTSRPFPASRTYNGVSPPSTSVRSSPMPEKAWTTSCALSMMNSRPYAPSSLAVTAVITPRSLVCDAAMTPWASPSVSTATVSPSMATITNVTTASGSAASVVSTSACFDFRLVAKALGGACL